jgi:hypothetical protein
MEQKNLNLLVLGFLTLIVGLALIGTIASNTLSVTTRTSVYDESFDLGPAKAGTADLSVNESLAASNMTLEYAPSGWQAVDSDSGCNVVASVIVGNSTLALTLDTDYEVFLDKGIIHFLNTTDTASAFGNTSVVDYTYCADDYLNSNFGRSVQKLIPGFFALALLGVSLLIFYSIGKSEGILN